MVYFKNEINNSEWIVGSIVIIIMIWLYLLFPRDFITISSTPLTLYRIPEEHWNWIAIYPQQADSLPAIFFAHFFHLSEAHLTGNLSLLTVFMIILAKISNRFIAILFGTMILSGLLIWCFNPYKNEFTNLSGASSLIFGLFSYVVLRTLFNKDFLNTIDSVRLSSKPKLILINAWVAFVTLSFIILYWRAIESSLDLNLLKQSDIAFHGHMYGFISGLIVYFAELFWITVLNRKNQNMQIR